MSVALSVWPEWEDTPEPSGQWLWLSCSHLERAETAAAEGDMSAAAHFFALADLQIRQAVVSAEVTNTLFRDGVSRMRHLARQLDHSTTRAPPGWAIAFHGGDDGWPISIWLKLGRIGPETGALLTAGRTAR